MFCSFTFPKCVLQEVQLFVILLHDLVLGRGILRINHLLPLGGRPAVHGQAPFNRPIQSHAASGSSSGNHTASSSSSGNHTAIGGTNTAPASRSGDTAVIELLT